MLAVRVVHGRREVIKKECAPVFRGSTTGPDVSVERMMYVLGQQIEARKVRARGLLEFLPEHLRERRRCVRVAPNGGAVTPHGGLRFSLKNVETKWMSEVRTKTKFIWWEGDFDDWLEEVHVKLEAGCLTMTETGGMGILSDHGWKKSRTTAKLLDEGGVYG